jgi:hypothetical protein
MSKGSNEAAVIRLLVVITRVAAAAAATNVFFITVELFVDPTLAFQHAKTY